VTPETFASELDLAAALGRRIIEIVRRHPSVVLALPTGRTPIALYNELVRLTRLEHVDWANVRTFNLDEFVGLGAGDAGSYRSFMNARLFDHINLRDEHIGFLDGRAADLERECARYERAIADVGGIDIMILGIGANGHVAFNEPADVLVARTHRAKLDPLTHAGNALWFGGDVDRVPREALTMGMATILRARGIVLVGTGESKAEAVHAVLTGGLTTHVPASFLTLHPHVTMMIDEPLAEALATLP
jgi:glucosamine-6-phosphate deaminase